MSESALREGLCMHGKSLYDRGLAAGSTGNMSVLTDEGDALLCTPTNSCLGRLDPAGISKVDLTGRHLGGDKPTKEVFLHLAMLKARPKDKALVHLHPTYAVAVSCLDGLDAADVLPAITPYYIMRLGKLPLVPYFRPGDLKLADAVAALARDHHAILMANHGTLVTAKSLDNAVYATEELEETAKLFFILQGHKVRPLTQAQIQELREHFPT